MFHNWDRTVTNRNTALSDQCLEYYSFIPQPIRYYDSLHTFFTTGDGPYNPFPMLEKPEFPQLHHGGNVLSRWWRSDWYVQTRSTITISGYGTSVYHINRRHSQKPLDITNGWMLRFKHIFGQVHDLNLTTSTDDWGHARSTTYHCREGKLLGFPSRRVCSL